MENNQPFTYNYSSARNREVERIRKKYLPKEESKIELLKKLDNRAQTAGTVEALVIGIIGCLIFGIGMCFGLDVFAGGDWLTVIFCVIGVLAMLPAYPLCRYLSKKTKEKLAPQILRLSEEIIANKQD